MLSISPLIQCLCYFETSFPIVWTGTRVGYRSNLTLTLDVLQLWQWVQPMLWAAVKQRCSWAVCLSVGVLTCYRHRNEKQEVPWCTSCSDSYTQPHFGTAYASLWLEQAVVEQSRSLFLSLSNRWAADTEMWYRLIEHELVLSSNEFSSHPIEHIILQ